MMACAKEVLAQLDEWGMGGLLVTRGLWSQAQRRGGLGRGFLLF